VDLARTFGDAALNCEEFWFGIYLLESGLRKVRATVEKEGELTDAALKELQFGGKANYLANGLAKANAAPVVNGEGLDEAGLKAKRRDRLLAWIDAKLGEYRWMGAEAREWEEHEESARKAATNLPSGETLDRILRYETTRERQLYRAMMQLERVQRRRQGEAVPPPLSLEVSSRC